MSLAVSPHGRVGSVPGLASRQTPRNKLERRSGSRGRTKTQWRCFGAAGDQESIGEVRELPMFPLSVVALPGCLTPLFIFEARSDLRAHTQPEKFVCRYRMMFNTLLAGGSEWVGRESSDLRICVLLVWMRS